jgi:hypothetical protein
MRSSRRSRARLGKLVVCAAVGVGLTAGLARAAPQTAAAEPRSRHQREIEELQRQDLAGWLAYWGVPVDWNRHTLAELADWSDRIHAAAALRDSFAVYVDWQGTSLAELTDMRLRAAKAAGIAGVYGIQVDWLRYSWADLEDLRQHIGHLASVRAPSGGVTALGGRPGDTLATPVAFAASGTRDPAGASRRLLPRDPDAIMEPSFAPKASVTWTAPKDGGRGRSRTLDPDAILPPTFATFSTPVARAPGARPAWADPEPAGDQKRERPNAAPA